MTFSSKKGIKKYINTQERLFYLISIFAYKRKIRHLHIEWENDKKNFLYDSDLYRCIFPIGEYWTLMDWNVFDGLWLLMSAAC